MFPAYFAVSAALTLAGLSAAWIWREQRGTILLSGTLLTPCAILEEWFEPDYWHPRHVFTLLQGAKTGPEDVLFCWGCGSLIWAMAAGLERRRQRGRPSSRSHAPLLASARHRADLPIWGRRYLISSAVVAATTAGCRLAGLDIMSAVLIGFGGPGAALLCARRDLAGFALSGASSFGLLHVAAVAIALGLWPECAEDWTLARPWGLRPLGVPCGEWVWALGIGAIWPAAVAFWLSGEKASSASNSGHTDVSRSAAPFPSPDWRSDADTHCHRPRVAPCVTRGNPVL